MAVGEHLRAGLFESNLEMLLTFLLVAEVMTMVVAATMAVATEGQEIFSVAEEAGRRKCDLMDELSSWLQGALELGQQTTAVLTGVAAVAWNRLRMGMLQMLQLFRVGCIKTTQMRRNLRVCPLKVAKAFTSWRPVALEPRPPHQAQQRFGRQAVVVARGAAAKVASALEEEGEEDSSAAEAVGLALLVLEAAVEAVLYRLLTCSTSRSLVRATLAFGQKRQERALEILMCPRLHLPRFV
ncbi:hypothetical protein PHYBOEH_000477 [Phytophthora boehmeriae]|uniref:Uncharacterized protein n=1 Tax=Phytophthora boehmeriae TaxID=109152 RepID=A0A8T1WWP8_9STRA|nr:hypothetical protein PHYBOEH_000477 [Phytophthora boehmeriae]